MILIGCDFHPSWQQVSWFDENTGEMGEQKLVHASGDAEKFYRQLGKPALIGMESTGNREWFVELVTTMGHTVWIGDAAKIRASDFRFPRGKQVASYLGLIPREYSSGGQQRLGSISKQGNRFMRMLLVEAAQVAVRCDPQMKREYLHRCHRKPKGVAKVAAARKLAIRLYWMLRTQKQYPEIVSTESSPRVPRVSAS